MTDAATEPVFSYGTLQLASVQRATFGRLLDTAPDALPGYELGELRIEDPDVLEASGEAVHPIARRSTVAGARVVGAVLMLTPDELAASDRYEVDAYARVRVMLASGRWAWCYVDAAEV